VDFLVFLIALIILVFLLEKVINKLLGVKRKKISETSGRNIDQWRRGIIVIIALCTLPFVVWNSISIKWFWIPYLILLLGSESFMEWKYIKDSKQYITTLIFLVLGLIIMCNVEYILSTLD
jgi:hypothetical protein